MRSASVQRASLRQADRGDAAVRRPAEQRRAARWSAGRGPLRHGRGSSRRAAKTAARSGLSASNAPAAARLSIWRRLSSLGSIRAAKSSRLVNGPLRLALGDQRLHRLLADALERAERIADLCRPRPRNRRATALTSGGRHSTPLRRMSSTNSASLSVWRHVEAHRRGEEFGRVMRLQPGGVIGDQRVGGGVALVEAIAGELVDQVEQLVGLGRRDVVGRRSPRRSARAGRPSPTWIFLPIARRSRSASPRL